MRWWDIDALLGLEDALFGEDAWSPALFWSELAQHDSRHYVVLADGEAIVGYGGVAIYDGEAYVQTVGVVPGRWGTGLGALLLTALLTTAEAAGVHTVVLEVRADNERAQRLYQRFGFTVIGVRRGYYQPSGADAHVMIRRTA
jgi:ribosomal-protein-alanine N-acetyltransferase